MIPLSTIRTRTLIATSDMPRYKTYLRRILPLTILGVAASPIYYLQVFDADIAASSSSSKSPAKWNRAPASSLEAAAASSSPLRLILHVGLPKTATSAIQCRLSDMERHDVLSKVLSAKIVEVESCRTDPFLHKVRIEQYLENFPHVTLQEIRNQSMTETYSKYTTYERVIKGSSVLQHCLDLWIRRHHQNSSVPDCWGDSYRKYIHNYRELGYSLFIISNENLALPSFGREESNPETCDNVFHNMLHSLGNESQIDIVLTQRLHFDRMLSMFGQEYDGDKFFTRPRLKRWPDDQGGDSVPFLEKYIRDFPTERFVRAVNCFRHVAENPRIRFHVLDFHNKRTDIVTAFVNVITRNDTLTERLADGHWTLGTENVAMERDTRIHYDRIAVAAKEAGLIPKSASRNEIRNDVSTYLQEKGLTTADLKLKCPSRGFYDDLIKSTAMIHQMSFPNEPADIIRQKMRMFDVPQFRDLFCEVDGNATLHAEVMQSFLAQYKT